jgi:hypothetical protein
LALRNIGLDPKEVEQRLKDGKEPWTDKDYTIECCQRAFWEHQMKIPKSTQTTKPKSKVTKPDDERRSVSVRASSSKQVKEPEDSDVEFWDERESRPKEDRFGKRPRTQIYKTVQREVRRKQNSRDQEADRHEKGHQNQ